MHLRTAPGRGCLPLQPAWNGLPTTTAPPGSGARPFPRFVSSLQLPFVSSPIAARAMTSEQAAQLIDHTLDLVHQRLQDLQAQCLSQEHSALSAEFREWRHPTGGHIDLMVFPGLANS